jgi:hypothetical protein
MKRVPITPQPVEKVGASRDGRSEIPVVGQLCADWALPRVVDGRRDNPTAISIRTEGLRPKAGAY